MWVQGLAVVACASSWRRGNTVMFGINWWNRMFDWPSLSLAKELDKEMGVGTDELWINYEVSFVEARLG